MSITVEYNPLKFYLEGKKALGYAAGGKKSLRLSQTEIDQVIRLHQNAMP